jgi:hypothetical protein
VSCLVLGGGHRYLGLSHPIDDSGFFFRNAQAWADQGVFSYSDGATKSFGVSAPLWAMLLACVAEWTGNVVAAGHALAVALYSLAILVVLAGFRNLRLRMASVAFLGIALINPRFWLWTSSGMEVCLGYFLFALGFLAVTAPRPRAAWCGALAALLVIHKLDYAGAALALLIAPALGSLERSSQAGRLRGVLGPLCLALLPFCLLLAFAGFVFEQSFGGLLPNSVGRKLSREYGSVSPLWFLRASLLSGSSAVFSLLAALAVWRKAIPLLPSAYCLAHVLSQALAYTLLPPAEPYSWYIAQTQLSLAILAAFGLHSLAVRWGAAGPRRPIGVGLAIVVPSLAVLLLDRGWFARMKHWSDTVERARVAAGQWACEHLPAQATIRTSFGLPAFYGKRRTWDTSGLTVRDASRPAWLAEDEGEVYEIDCRFVPIGQQAPLPEGDPEPIATFKASTATRYAPDLLDQQDFLVTITRR